MKTLHFYDFEIETAPRIGSYLVCPPEVVHRIIAPSEGEVALRLAHVEKRAGESDRLIWHWGNYYFTTRVGQRQRPRRNVSEVERRLRIEGKALRREELGLARDIAAATSVGDAPRSRYADDLI